MLPEEYKAKLAEAADYNLRFEYKQAQAICLQVLATETIQEYPGFKIQALVELFRSTVNAIDKTEVTRTAETALELATNYTGPDAEALLASVYLIMNTAKIWAADSVKAFEYAETAIAIYKALNDTLGLSRAYGLLAFTCKDVSDFTGALQHYETAYNLALQCGNEFLELQWMWSMGSLHVEIREFERGLYYFSKVLPRARQLNFKMAEASALMGNSSAYSLLEKPEAAFENMHQAMALFEKLGDTNKLALCTGNMGSLYYGVDEMEKAHEFLNRALDLERGLNNKLHEATWIYLLGNVFSSPGFSGYDVDKAEQHYLQALQLSKEINYKLRVYGAHHALSNLYKDREDWKAYAYHLAEYYRVEKEVKNEQLARQTQLLEYRRRQEEAERDRQLKLARFQEQEKILYNILPAPIAERMLDGEKQIADYCDNVSVFFCDIVNFTGLSESISPAETVNVLNELFSEFDRIARKHGLEKIKTIGDAYMAVAGVPVPLNDHADRTAAFALDILEAMRTYSQRTGNQLEVRIGLHCGNAVAGVIGESKFAYDLWGDTINTASRMETHGEPGKIHVSEDFKRATGQQFAFEHRGEIDVKGKGKMKTYFLVG